MLTKPRILGAAGDDIELQLKRYRAMDLQRATSSFVNFWFSESEHSDDGSDGVRHFIALQS